MLYTTGCRISEALALTPGHVDLTGKAVVFETLKKRRRDVYRGAAGAMPSSRCGRAAG